MCGTQHSLQVEAVWRGGSNTEPKPGHCQKACSSEHVQCRNVNSGVCFVVGTQAGGGLFGRKVVLRFCPRRMTFNPVILRAAHSMMSDLSKQA